jgi:hypothetical protein
MMPVVRVSDATFADLKSIAAWFGTRTPGETIDRVVREAMQQLGMERDDEAEGTPTTTSSGTMEFQSAPGLAFTKPISASVNGTAIDSPRWAGILLTTIAQVKAKGIEGDRLVRELHIPAKVERYEEEGFKYYPDLGISVQGQSASEAWKEVERLANKWRILVTVEFSWRQNPKAQYPGRTGLLRSGNA